MVGQDRGFQKVLQFSKPTILAHIFERFYENENVKNAKSS